MPQPVRLSLWLLVAGVIASPLISLLDPTPTPPLPEGSGPLLFFVIIVFSVPFFGALIFFAVMAYRRRTWARWVHSGILLFGIVLYVPAQIAALEVSIPLPLLNLIVAAIELASAALLFTRESNAWYSATVAGAA